MKQRDTAYPSRPYVPWLRWLVMLAGALAAAFAIVEPMSFILKAMVVIAVLALLLTYYPIKQRFVLSDGMTQFSFLARASFFARVTVVVESAGRKTSIKLGNLSNLTSQMHFEPDLGGLKRRFSLGHLVNTRYFLLAENVDDPAVRASVKSNTFCF